VGGDVLVVILGLGDPLGDLDLGVQLHVLVVEVLVAELAERRDDQLGLAAGRGLVTAAATARGGGGGQGDGDGRDSQPVQVALQRTLRGRERTS
jgi:hypothetical protein